MSAIAGRFGRTAGVTLAVWLLASGCRVGTDLPTVEPPELLEAEAVALAAALLGPTLTHSVFSDHHVSFTHEHGAAGLHRHPVAGPWVHEVGGFDGPLLSHHNLFDFDLSVEPPCDAGGALLVEAAVSGEGNPAVGTGAVHYAMIQTHQSCTRSVEGVGDVLFEAAPYLTVESHAVNAGGAVRIYGSVDGTLEWQAETKGGRCAIDLSWEGAAATWDALTDVALTGRFCSIELDDSIPIG